MFDRINRSWELGKQSWLVLKGDKRLVVFPLISACACVLVLASFAVPFLLTTDFEAGQNTRESAPPANNPWYYVVLFAYYFVNYSVIVFFNSALIGCAMRRFEGEDATVGTGLRIAMSRLPQILGWALLSATVGVVLRAIAERLGFVGKIVIGLLGFAWTVATYFVVPALVVEGLGPIAAVKRSTEVIRKSWGEALVTNVGLGALSMVGGLLALIPLLLGVVLAVATGTVWPAITGVVLMLVLLIALALVTSTLQMILVAALYRYAATGLVPEGFDGDLLKQVFKKKGE